MSKDNPGRIVIIPKGLVNPDHVTVVTIPQMYFKEEIVVARSPKKDQLNVIDTCNNEEDEEINHVYDIPINPIDPINPIIPMSAINAINPMNQIDPINTRCNNNCDDKGTDILNERIYETRVPSYDEFKSYTNDKPPNYQAPYQNYNEMSYLSSNISQLPHNQNINYPEISNNECRSYSFQLNKPTPNIYIPKKTPVVPKKYPKNHLNITTVHIQRTGTPPYPNEFGNFELKKTFCLPNYLTSPSFPRRGEKEEFIQNIARVEQQEQNKVIEDLRKMQNSRRRTMFSEDFNSANNNLCLPTPEINFDYQDCR